jgi:hypothetical protein
MVIKAGLQGENVSAHSIRKYHQTMLEASGMPDTWIALIQGRKIADSRRAYTRPTNEQLIEAYKEAYPELALSEPTTNEQIQDLQQENEKLHETISQLQEQITQMKEDYWMVRAIRPDASPELKARLRKLILTPDPEMETALRKAEEHYPINDTLLEGKIRNMVKSMLTERNGKASYTKIESSNEEQLLKLLNEGWDIYKELNGKIILRR